MSWYPKEIGEPKPKLIQQALTVYSGKQTELLDRGSRLAYTRLFAYFMALAGHQGDPKPWIMHRTRQDEIQTSTGSMLPIDLEMRVLSDINRVLVLELA